MITDIEDENKKSKKKFKKHKMITTIRKSFDIIAIIATTTSSITLNLTGIGVIAIPISTATACGLSSSNKVIYEIVIKKHNKYKIQNEKDQQTIKSFDKVYGKNLQDETIGKKQYESLCELFAGCLEETGTE